jgi:hypothetical protein
MAKSLSETAKAILMKESNDATPDRDANNTNPNSATLHPKSNPDDSKAFANPGADSPSGAYSNDAEDLGPALVKQGDVPPSAKASKKIGKDTSASSQSSRKAAPAEKSASAEAMEEDFEISEELQNFIQEKMAEGLSEDQIAEAIEANFEMVSEDTAEESVQNEEIAQEKVAKIDMSEHIEALLQGEDLSEEFKEKATTIFEAAVQQKVEEELVKIQEAYAETLEEQVQEITENLSSNVDDYLNYVVEQWVTENEVAIENGLRTELTEDFITGLRQLFAENYIDIPEDKVSVIEELGSKVTELESKLNEEIDRNVYLNRTLGESKQFEVLANACDGLTDTQAEKLKTLSEGVEFTSEGEFTKKIMTLRENYFPIRSTGEGNLALDRAEIESSPDGRVLNENLQGPMARYVQTLGRKLPN